MVKCDVQMVIVAQNKKSDNQVQIWVKFVVFTYVQIASTAMTHWFFSVSNAVASQWFDIF